MGICIDCSMQKNEPQQNGLDIKIQLYPRHQGINKKLQPFLDKLKIKNSQISLFLFTKEKRARLMRFAFQNRIKYKYLPQAEIYQKIHSYDKQLLILYIDRPINLQKIEKIWICKKQGLIKLDEKIINQEKKKYLLLLADYKNSFQIIQKAQSINCKQKNIFVQGHRSQNDKVLNINQMFLKPKKKSSIPFQQIIQHTGYSNFTTAITGRKLIGCSSIDLRSQKGWQITEERQLLIQESKYKTSVKLNPKNHNIEVQHQV